MTAAFRAGWERIFGPPSPKMLNCPFNLRRRMVLDISLPSDLKLREVRRFAQFLTTMCDDWDHERGLPALVFEDERTS